MDNQQIVKFLIGTRDFSLLQSVQTTLGLNHPCIQWGPGAFFQGIEWPRNEEDHSSQFNADIKKEGSYIALPSMPSWYAQGLLHFYLWFSRTNEKHAQPRAILVMEVM